MCRSRMEVQRVHQPGRAPDDTAKVGARGTSASTTRVPTIKRLPDTSTLSNTGNLPPTATQDTSSRSEELPTHLPADPARQMSGLYGRLPSRRDHQSSLRSHLLQRLPGEPLPLGNERRDALPTTMLQEAHSHGRRQRGAFARSHQRVQQPKGGVGDERQDVLLSSTVLGLHSSVHHQRNTREVPAVP